MSPETLLLFDEDEEDVESQLTPEIRAELQQTIVYNLDWTIATVLTQLQEGAIDLQPQYQRRDAWTVGRKSKLIESFILGLPVPPVVLAERREAKGSFIVLDGKQRLTTLAQFTGNFPSSPLNGFALTELPLLPALEGVTFTELLEQETHSQTRNAFLNQPLKTAIMRGWESADLLHIVFHRLNSQVVPLSPQELRQALIRGPFMTFINEYSAKSTTMRWLLGLEGPDFRMRDTELLLRLLALTQYRDEYRGDLRKFLDRLAQKLSAAWDTMADQTVAALSRIEEALELWGLVLERERVGRKFVEGKYEGRLNRAVLDAQVYAALDPVIEAKVRARPDRAKKAFENLMAKDTSFRRAIESTTKSVDAVRYRMDALQAALSKI